jgi:hypothetical protein
MAKNQLQQRRNSWLYPWRHMVEAFANARYSQHCDHPESGNLHSAREIASLRQQ